MQYGNNNNYNNNYNNNNNFNPYGPFFGQGYSNPSGGPVFTVSQIKKIARMKLKGKWGKALVPAMIYMVLYMIPTVVLSVATQLYTFSGSENEMPQSLLLLSDGVSLYQFIVMGAFMVSMATLSLDIIRNENITPATAFTGFKKFPQSFFIGLLYTVFSTLWMVLAVLPGSMVMGVALTTNNSALIFVGASILFAGCIAGYIWIMKYRMSAYIASDYRDMRATEVIARSVAMMKKNTFSLFALNLSFFGWALLVAAVIYGAVYFITMSSSAFSTAAGVVFVAAAAVSYALLLLYIGASEAVFYSGMSGNFRTDFSDEEANDLPAAVYTDSPESVNESSPADSAEPAQTDVTSERDL